MARTVVRATILCILKIRILVPHYILLEGLLSKIMWHTKTIMADEKVSLRKSGFYFFLSQCYHNTDPTITIHAMSPIHVVVKFCLKVTLTKTCTSTCMFTLQMCVAVYFFF